MKILRGENPINLNDLSSIQLSYGERNSSLKEFTLACLFREALPDYHSRQLLGKLLSEPLAPGIDLHSPVRVAQS